MANTIIWFELPKSTKEKITSRIDGDKDCLDSPAVRAALEDIEWFNSPKKHKTLVEAINAVTPEDPYVITYKYWFQLEKEVGLLLDYIDSVDCFSPS